MLKTLWVSLFIMLTCLLYGQCPESDAGPDQFECSIPATFELDGDVDGDVICYYWTPEDDLSDPFSLSPDATISVPTTYYLVSKGIDNSINLVDNGDFSGGDSGFYTDYIYHDSPSLPLDQLLEGEYTVGSDPAPMHINWEDCGDHTSGSGDMMVVNGSEISGQQVWCQDIAVDPDTQYAFSAWVVSVDPNGPVEIQFSINNGPIGDGNVGLNSTCDWVNFYELWDSGGNTSITICIEDVNTAEMGNDFAIDDISFSPLCESIDSVTLTPSVFEPEIFFDTPICEGDNIVMYGEGADFYEWDGPDNFSSFDSDVTLFDATLDMAGQYYLEVENDAGCTELLMAFIEILPADYTEFFEDTCDPNEEGVFTDSFINANGCESFEVTTYTFVSPSIENITTTSCDMADVGIEVLNLTNQFGCDSIVSIETTFVDSDLVTFSEFTCDASATGFFTQTLVNMNGCDSIVETSITLFSADTTFVVSQSCDLTLIGLFNETFQNQSGCDSIVQTNTTLFPTDSVFIVANTCDPSLVGISSLMLQNQNGCDSIVTVETALFPIDSTFINDTTCDPSLAGITVETLQQLDGCDSVVIFELILLPSDTTYLLDTTCDMALAGLVVDVLQNQYGCDSIVESEVEFIEEDVVWLYETNCDIDLVGVFTQDLQNEFGCDSIVTTEIIWVQADSTFIAEPSCDLNDVGVFVEVLQGVSGCDSIVTTEITWVETDSTFIVQGSCDPSDVGIFVDALQGLAGCDSIVTTEVILEDENITDLFLETCIPGSVGVNVENLVNQFGCDSIVTTSISLSIQDTSYIFIETCDSLATGISTENFMNQFGCDSMVVTESIYFFDLALAFDVAQPDCFEENMGAITVVADGGTAPYFYSINNGLFSENSTFLNLNSGVYELTVIDANDCMNSEFIIINSVMPVSVDLGDDLSITNGEGAELEAMVNVPIDSIASVVWFPIEASASESNLSQTVYPIITTSYSIEVINSFGCTAQDLVTVAVDLGLNIYVPNVISSDGLSFNDKLIIYAKEGVVKNINSFQGYDRWGENIWEFQDFLPNSTEHGWDGRFQGDLVNPGVFVWRVEVEFVDGSEEVFTGTVTFVN